MKKILGLIGLVGILLTSCKNDAIQISRVPTPEPPKTLSLSISTTSAYEKYGLADYQNYLGSNSTTYIAVTSLLYNSSGTLVDSASSYSRTFNAISQSFSGLYNGSYTIITFETLVDSSNGFKSNNWQLKDINNISTVQVHNEKYNHVSWQYSVGVSTQVVEINSADRQIEISPKPIGVLLDFGYENYGKSGYIWTAFELKNVASGYNLNPSLSANERYTYDDGYNAEHTWSNRGYFYNSSGLSNSDSEKFYMLESGNIQYCFAATDKLNDNGGFSFTACPSENAFFNFVDGEYYKVFAYYTGYSTPLYTFVGSKDDFSTWHANISSELAKIFLCEMPYLNWGASVNDVKSFMSSYTIYNDTPEALGSGMYRITYGGKYKESQIGYLFNTESGDLAIVNVFWNPTSVTKKEVEDFLKSNGYSYTDGDNQESRYVSSDNNTNVRVLTNSEGLILAQFSQNVVFRIPYLTWGGSVSAVQSYMSSYTAGNNSPEVSGDFYVLWYYGKDKEDEIDYYFTSQSGGLAYVNVFFDSNVGEDEIQSKIVSDGFSLVEYDSSNGIYYYLSSDKKTVAAFLKNSQGYWLVQYYAYSSGGGKDDSRLFEEPYLDWGASMSTVKNYMSGKDYTIEYEGDDYLAYYPKYKELDTWYFFTSNALESSAVYFDPSVVTISELEKIVKDSGATYRSTSSDGESSYYSSADGKNTICIGTSSYSGEHYLMYWENTSSTRTRAYMGTVVKKCNAIHQKASASRKAKARPKTKFNRVMDNTILAPRAEMKPKPNKMDNLIETSCLKK